MADLDLTVKVVDQSKRGLDSLNRNLDRSEQKTGLLGKAGGVAGAAIAAGAVAGATALVKFTGDTIQAAANIDNLANVSQLGVENLQAIAAVAERSGGNIEDVADAAREMQLRLAEAARLGSGPAVDALNLLGVSLDELDALTPAEQFDLLRDRISEIEDPAERAFIAEELLGGASERLAETLALSAEAFDEQTEAALRSGRVLDEEAIATATEASEKIADFTASVTGLAQEFVIDLLPAVSSVAEGLSGLVRWAADTTFGFGKLSGELERLESTSERVTRALVLQSGGHLTNAEAAELAEERIVDTREAMEGYVAVATEAGDATGYVTGQYGEAAPAVADMSDAVERLNGLTGPVAGDMDEIAAAIRGVVAEAEDLTDETGDVTDGLDGLGEGGRRTTSVLMGLGAELISATDEMQGLMMAAYDSADAFDVAADAAANMFSQSLKALDNKWDIPEPEYNPFGEVINQAEIDAAVNRHRRGGGSSTRTRTSSSGGGGRRSSSRSSGSSSSSSSGSETATVVREVDRESSQAVGGSRSIGEWQTILGASSLGEASRLLDQLAEAGIDTTDRNTKVEEDIKKFQEAAAILDRESSQAVGGSRSIGEWQTILGASSLGEASRLLDQLAEAGIDTTDRNTKVEEDIKKFQEAAAILGDAPKMAMGGIVTRPTFAMLGEAGPEAVVPLGGGGQPLTVVLELDGSRLGEAVISSVNQAAREGTLLLSGSYAV